MKHVRPKNLTCFFLYRLIKCKSIYMSMKKKSKIANQSTQLQFYYRNRERILARNKLKRLESRANRIVEDYGDTVEGKQRLLEKFIQIIESLEPNPNVGPPNDEYI